MYKRSYGTKQYNIAIQTHANSKPYLSGTS